MILITLREMLGGTWMEWEKEQAKNGRMYSVYRKPSLCICVSVQSTVSSPFFWFLSFTLAITTEGWAAQRRQEDRGSITTISLVTQSRNLVINLICSFPHLPCISLKSMTNDYYSLMTLLPPSLWNPSTSKNLYFSLSLKYFLDGLMQ